MSRLLAIAAGSLLALSLGATAAQTQVRAQPGATDKTFDAWDGDHDGVLSRAEFSAGWQAIRKRGAEARLRSQFDKLDVDNDGSLDPAEYANLALVRRAGKGAPALAAFDTNRDKRLQFGEYVASVRTLTAASRKPTPPPAPIHHK